MIVMQLNNIAKSFGATEILKDIKLEIKHRDRIAIVGRNGAGKSTLLKIMADELTYDAGEIMKPKEVEIGYLAQHTVIESKYTIWEEMLTVFSHFEKEEKKLRQLEQKMADSQQMTAEAYDELLREYDRLHESFQTSGGYEYESEIRSVLNGLDFTDIPVDTKIVDLSGGQKTRLALGKLLLQKPEVLILDEPTNHLDIETLSWLESYLTNYSGAVVIVSHDRYFLDKTVNIVYEISRKRSKRYIGTYSKYLEQKAIDYERELRAYESEQAFIQSTEDFIQRNIARASTSKRATSRRRQLERMDFMDRPEGDEASASFSFTIKKQSGNDVVKINDLAFSYDDEEENLFSHVTFDATRGERIALVGPNGVGKTTLLKLLTGTLPIQDGTITLGTNVEIGYYDQEQKELHSTKAVLHELWDEDKTVTETEIRTILGNFLFSGDDVLKEVHSLSGGEKARLALAKLMLQKANLLVLDEPTNHLDIDSKEVLEAALLDYPGTIIFVSHDRYFINRIADKVVELNRRETKTYLGDYDYYIEKKAEEKAIEELEQEERLKRNAGNVQEQSKPISDYHLNKKIESELRKKRRRLEAIEAEVEQLEAKLEELELEMTKPEVYEDHEEALKYTEMTESVRIQMEEYMDEWTELAEELE